VLELRMREKIVEVLVLVEHLPVFATTEGLAIFGGLCEGLGRCCRHLASGDRDQALKVATTIGRSVPHAVPLGNERDVLEAALEEVIAVLEAPEGSHLH
jgi:hypothetical protein